MKIATVLFALFVLCASVVTWFVLGWSVADEIGINNVLVLTENDSKDFDGNLYALGCGSVIYDNSGNVLKKGPPCDCEKGPRSVAITPELGDA